MLYKWKKIRCPFCLAQFAASEVIFRCKNLRCAKEPDDVYHRAHGGNPIDKGHVFTPPSTGNPLTLIKAPKEATCDRCSMSSGNRLCPTCHHDLLDDAGEYDDHWIAVIGGRGTGKGHYFTTLVHRLQQEVGPHFGFSFDEQGEDTRTRYRLEYKIPLLNNREVLQPTPSASIDANVKSPLIFKFIQPITTQRTKRVYFSFFDSAGEDMLSLDAMSTEARYICSAAGIIFLLDPLQIDTVRQKLPQEGLPLRDMTGEPGNIVGRLRELFERHQGLSGTKKIKTPVAFVLSKVDTLFPVIDRASALRGTGGHFGAFNLTDAESVNTEVQNYLDSWMGKGFSNSVRYGFAKYKFFGVSSLGRQPDERGNLESVSPIRVEDPFLWLMHLLGQIKASR
jgi:hypothetical protein